MDTNKISNTNNIKQEQGSKLQHRSPLPAGHKLQLGDIIYEIIRVIGFGSSAIVYEAKYQDSLNKESIHQIYIKELYPYIDKEYIWREADGSIRWSPEIDSIMEDRRYFFKKGNEINLSLLKSHPSNISGNMNSYEAHGTYYTLLPIHGGASLQDYLLENGPLPLQQCVEIMKEILLSIQQFHKNKLLIMDVSPDNILILPHQAMFIDYNSVWDIDDEEGDYIFSQKEGYTPPEILFCDVDEIGPWSDLYSACAVFYEMILGKKLQPNEMNQLAKALKNSPLLREESEEILQKLLSIFRKGLVPLTRKRYQTCEEFLWDVDVLLGLLEKKPVEKKPVEKKSSFKPAYFLVPAILLILCGFWAYEVSQKEPAPTILHRGNSNSNLLNRGRLCMVEGQYLYYVDGDGNLRMSNYDAQTESFTYDENEMVFPCKEDISDDSVAFLNVGKDLEGNDNKIYFLYAGGTNHGDSLRSMNLDGSDQKILCSFGDQQQGDQFTYVMFEDGQEYIYYLMADIPEQENDLRNYDLCRLDLDTMETETLMSHCVEWFNVYNQYLYYTNYDDAKEAPVLKRASLTGENPIVIDDSQELWDGFVEDDTLFMFSLMDDECTMILCDLDGNIKGDAEHPYSKTFDTLDFDYVYADQWIYYSDYAQKQLRRFNVNMTSDQVVYENVDSYGMSCFGSYLFLYDGEKEDTGNIAANKVLLRDKSIQGVKMYHLPK